MRIGRPGHGTIVAYLALVLTLSGTAYAAVTVTGANVRDGSLGTRDIANNSIRSLDVRQNSLTGQDVLDGSITRRDIRKGALLPGPPGPRGATGPAGPAGSARAFAAVTAAGGLVEGSRNVRQIRRLGAGRYCVRLVDAIDAGRAVPIVGANLFGSSTDLTGANSDDAATVQALSVNQECRDAGVPNAIAVRGFEQRFDAGAFLGNFAVDAPFFIFVP